MKYKVKQCLSLISSLQLLEQPGLRAKKVLCWVSSGVVATRRMPLNQSVDGQAAGLQLCSRWAGKASHLAPGFDALWAALYARHFHNSGYDHASRPIRGPQTLCRTASGSRRFELRPRSGCTIPLSPSCRTVLQGSIREFPSNFSGGPLHQKIPNTPQNWLVPVRRLKVTPRHTSWKQ